MLSAGCTFDLPDFFPSSTRDPEVGRIRNCDHEWAMKVWVDRNSADEEDYFLYPLGWFDEGSGVESEAIVRAERGYHFLYIKGYCRIRGRWVLAACGIIEFHVDSRMNGDYGWTVDIRGGQLDKIY